MTLHVRGRSSQILSGSAASSGIALAGAGTLPASTLRRSSRQRIEGADASRSSLLPVQSGPVAQWGGRTYLLACCSSPGAVPRCPRAL